MDLVLLTFNINIFTQHAILTAESKSIMKLMPFIEKDFFPSHGDAINNDTGVRSKILRVDKDAEGCRLSVIFAPWAISINIESEMLLELPALIQKFEYLFDLINKSFIDEDVKGNRVAAILTAGIKQSEDLNGRIYHKFFKGEVIPFEWSLRQAKATDFEGENIFNIVSVNKGHATISFSEKIFDGDTIVVNIDNNTHPANVTQRFTFDEYEFTKQLIAKTLHDFYTLQG
ncbi:hypothetical protein ACRAOD_16655 [Raoultella ornithinolytica]|uniref:hypothetical protein n=1 Tax=Raoultella ornithinolytica TaxID=54291 RepID=UPI0021BA909E|nr:hypothetical protein [Raoultella ornithinolytica]MCT8171515.1 hypothetical protein [Raoultella ornithinolytica]HDS7794634.1 hypothetical protein [Raoultella ornithinolytica]